MEFVDSGKLPWKIAKFDRIEWFLLKKECDYFDFKLDNFCSESSKLDYFRSESLDLAIKF